MQPLATDHAVPWTYVLPFVVCFAVTSALAFVIGARRARNPAARWFAVSLTVQSAWTLAYLFELRAPDVRSKLFWDNIQWLILPLLMAAGLGFALRYAGVKASRVRAAAWISALAVAVSALVIGFESAFGSLRASARIEYSGPVPALLYEFTVWDLLTTATSYAVLVPALGRLVMSRSGQTPTHRRRTSILILTLLLPSLLALVAFTGLRPFGQRDGSPLAFALGGLMVFWGIFRHELFDILPVAREAVFEAIPDPVFVLDDRMRIVDANAAAQRLAPGKALEGAVVNDVVPALANVDLNAALAPNTVRHADRQLVIHIVPLLEPEREQRRLGTAIVLRDVTEVERLNSELEERVRERTTELLQATLHLRDSETKLRAVFDGTNTLIGLLDVDGTVLASNRVSLELVGAKEEQVVGRPFADTAFWSHDAEARRNVEDAITRARQGELVRFETTHRSALGELRVIDFVLTPFRNEAGQVAWLIPEGRDVTALKRSEQQKAELTRRLGHAERLEALGRLASSVAHDFNNLLSVIGGNAELLSMEVQGKQLASDLLRDLRLAVASATTLTRQLVQFGRKPSHTLETLEVDARLRGVSSMLERLTGPETLFEIECGAAAARVRMESGQYEQLVVNLLVNAQQALSDGGKITLRTALKFHREAPEHAILPLPAEGYYVVTSVTDDGPGIPHDILERIFEPFFTTKENGTGLGLATVSAITTQAGGMICVSSTPGKGTTIEIHLPAILARTAEIAARA